MTDDVLLSIEDRDPAALQVFKGVTRWVMYRTRDIWVGAPAFASDGKHVTASVMFPDPSSPEAETGMWWGMSVHELLNGDFWTLVMNAQHELEQVREKYADWSKHPDVIELPPDMWEKGQGNETTQ